MDIKELAILYEKAHRPYSELELSDVLAYDREFKKYLENHEHLVEAYPYLPAREQRLSSSVRAHAHSILINGLKPDDGSNGGGI